MELDIVPRYVALFGIGLIVLSIRVIRLRRAEQVPIGTGGRPALERAIRVQANFCEYAPLALLLLTFMELSGYPGWILHLLCLTLLAGRAVHAIGVARVTEDYRFRVAGMAATFGVIGIASLLVLAGSGLATAVFG